MGIEKKTKVVDEGSHYVCDVTNLEMGSNPAFYDGETGIALCKKVAQRIPSTIRESEWLLTQVVGALSAQYENSEGRSRFVNLHKGFHIVWYDGTRSYFTHHTSENAVRKMVEKYYRELTQDNHVDLLFMIFKGSLRYVKVHVTFEK